MPCLRLPSCDFWQKWALREAFQFTKRLNVTHTLMKSVHNDSKSPSHLHWASPAAAVTTGLLTSNLAVYQDNRMTECGRYWYCGIWCWGGKLLSNTWQALMKPQPLSPATCIMFPQSSASSMGRGGHMGFFPFVLLWSCGSFFVELLIPSHHQSSASFLVLLLY